MVNTWGSYGNGKRPGFRSEVANTIRGKYRTFVLACAFFVYFRGGRGRRGRVLHVNFRSFRLFNFFQVHFSW